MQPVSLSRYFLIYIFLRFFKFYFWREGKGGRKRGRETSMCKRSINQLLLTRPAPGTWPETQACALTGNQTGNLLVHRLALNPLSHTSQGSRYFIQIISWNFCSVDNDNINNTSIFNIQDSFPDNKTQFREDKTLL